MVRQPVLTSLWHLFLTVSTALLWNDPSLIVTERSGCPAATTTLVATETGTPGNHSICFARRITTDPLKMQVTRQRETEGRRKERAEEEITNGKILACCQGNSEASTLGDVSMRLAGRVGGWAVIGWREERGRGLGGEPVCLIGWQTDKVTEILWPVRYGGRRHWRVIWLPGGGVALKIKTDYTR